MTDFSNPGSHQQDFNQSGSHEEKEWLPPGWERKVHPAGIRQPQIESNWNGWFNVFCSSDWSDGDETWGEVGWSRRSSGWVWVQKLLMKFWIRIEKNQIRIIQLLGSDQNGCHNDLYNGKTATVLIVDELNGRTKRQRRTVYSLFAKIVPTEKRPRRALM